MVLEVQKTAQGGRERRRMGCWCWWKSLLKANAVIEVDGDYKRSTHLQREAICISRRPSAAGR